jgi:excisionase family DNA binding protein
MDPAFASVADIPRAFSINDTARNMGVSRSTIYELFATGELAYVKIGKRRLVEGDEIRRFISAHRVGGVR